MSPLVQSILARVTPGSSCARQVEEASISVTDLATGRVTVIASVTALTPALTPATSRSTSASSSSTAPRLHEGKTVPGPDEWRALERRASSFRLRGSGGCIGRPCER